MCLLDPIAHTVQVRGAVAGYRRGPIDSHVRGLALDSPVARRDLECSARLATHFQEKSRLLTQVCHVTIPACSLVTRLEFITEPPGLRGPQPRGGDSQAQEQVVLLP